MSKIKIGNQDIKNIYLGSQPIYEVYLGSTPLLGNSQRGTIEGTDISFEIEDGVLTFHGVGTLPQITSEHASKITNAIGNITSIIIDNTITSIAQEALGCFKNSSTLISITLPFIGAKYAPSGSEYSYPLGYIFDYTEIINNDSNSYTINVLDGKEARENSSRSKPCKTSIPSSLKTVILNGNFSNKSIIYRNAFVGGNSSNLTTLSISDNVNYIAAATLAFCTSLVNLTLPFIGHKGLIFGASMYDEDGMGFGIIFGNSSFQGSTAYTFYGTPNDNVNNTSYSQYTAYIPNSLINIIITGYDVGYHGCVCSYMLNNVEQRKFTFTSTNPARQTLKLGKQAFNTNLELPNTLSGELNAIGLQLGISLPNRTLNFNGTSSQWNILNTNYKKFNNTSMDLFFQWNN